jgi:hypothetical protein
MTRTKVCNIALIARHASLILSLAVLIVGSRGASACGNGKLILDDKFNSVASAWSIEKKYTKLSPGPVGLTIVVSPGKDVGALNEADTYKNFELCMWVSLKSGGADDMFAVRFWTPDGADEYWAVTWPAKGQFVVNRYVNDNPTAITSQIENSGLLDAGGENEIGVSVIGNKGTFSVNGKKVTDFVGQPPDKGSIFGFLVSADKHDRGSATFVLRDVQVRDIDMAR